MRKKQYTAMRDDDDLDRIWDVGTMDITNLIKQPIKLFHCRPLLARYQTGSNLIRCVLTNLSTKFTEVIHEERTAAPIFDIGLDPEDIDWV